MDVVSVAKNAQGLWMMTLNGSFLGGSRPQPTKEAAEQYAHKIAGSWIDTEFKFGSQEGE